MTLHTENLAQPTTGRYCYICDEQYHEPYSHKQGEFWHAGLRDALQPSADGRVAERVA